jgi:hypothetical protein
LELFDGCGWAVSSIFVSLFHDMFEDWGPVRPNISP